MRILLEAVALREKASGEEMSIRQATRGDLIQYSLFVFILGLLSGLIITTGVRWPGIVALAVNTLIALGGFVTIDETLPRKPTND